MRPIARWGGVSLAAVLGSGVVLGIGGQAQAGIDDVTFDAITNAYGVEFRLTNPSIPTGIALEGSGPTSQATLDSLPQGTAFASLPYPGDTGANITGPIKALSGLPVPDYPFYIFASNGSPPPTGGHYPGGIDLAAESTDNRSAAKATAFTEAAGYVAESVISQGKDGAVTALSTATQNGLQIGGALTLSNVLSVAKAVLDTDGDVTTSSSLTVGKFIAPALDITLPAEYCPPNQPCIPNPFQGQVLSSPDLSYSDGTFFVSLPGAGAQKYPVPESSAVDAFKALGIDLTIQEAITTKNGVTAPTLVLKSVLPSPPDNQLYNGDTPIAYTIGRTSAQIVGSVAAALKGAVSPAGSPVVTTPEFTAGTDAPLAVAPGAPVAPAGPVVGVPLEQVPTVELSPAGQGASDRIVTTALSGQDGQLDTLAPFYPVLIGVALLALLGVPAIGYLGARS